MSCEDAKGQILRGGGLVKTETETEVTHPQPQSAEDGVGGARPPEARTGPSPGPFREHSGYLHLHLGHLAPRTVGE